MCLTSRVVTGSRAATFQWSNGQTAARREVGCLVEWFELGFLKLGADHLEEDLKKLGAAAAAPTPGGAAPACLAAANGPCRGGDENP